MQQILGSSSASYFCMATPRGLRSNARLQYCYFLTRCCSIIDIENYHESTLRSPNIYDGIALDTPVIPNTPTERDQAMWTTSLTSRAIASKNSE